MWWGHGRYAMGRPSSRRPSGAATAYRLPHAAHKPGWPLCPAKRYSTTITDGGDTIEPFLSGLSEKGIDLAPLVVLQQAVTKLPIFCTPKGPGQYGWAGVDGIHFLLLSVALGMVFAVSPMNPRPTMYIRWRTGFSGLCGCSGLRRQHGSGTGLAWDLPQFEAFLAVNPPHPRAEHGGADPSRPVFSPMEALWHYLHQLQTSFDYSKIKYTQEFYDLDLNPDAPNPRRNGRSPLREASGAHSREAGRGKSWPLAKNLTGPNIIRLILRLPLCQRVGYGFLHAGGTGPNSGFHGKWDLTMENEGQRQFSQEGQMQLALENPLILDFRSTLQVNGKKLELTHGSGTASPLVWERDTPTTKRSRLWNTMAWTQTMDGCLRAFLTPWATKRKPTIRSLSLTMIQEPVSIPGPHLKVCHPGTTATFLHKGQEHTLTVQEYESKIMDWSSMPGHWTGAPQPLRSHELHGDSGASGWCFDPGGLPGPRPRRPPRGEGALTI